MGALGRTLRRTGMVAATTAAFTLAGAGIASAHHCYKVEWTEKAYAQLSANNTAWMSFASQIIKRIASNGPRKAPTESSA